MADPFNLPLTLMQTIAALFGIFIAIFILAVQAINNDKNEAWLELSKEEKECQAIISKRIDSFVKKFFYIACLVLIFELFNGIILFFITDKSFEDFYSFEICSYAGFILIFTLIIRYMYELILLSFAFQRRKFCDYCTHFSNMLLTFNQITLFSAIVFLCIAIYFYLIKRLTISVSSVMLSIFFCVFSGLIIWHLFQKEKFKSAKFLVFNISCLVLLLLHSQAVIFKYSQNLQMNLLLAQFMVFTIPLVLLLLTRLDYTIFMRHQMDFKKPVFRELDQYIQDFKNRKRR